MFIELSEVLACPACGPPQGLVVMVEEMDGRRVTDGYLGCPMCEAHFPIEAGEIDLGGDDAREGDAAAVAAGNPGRGTDRSASSGGAPAVGGGAERTALLIAALFDVTDGRGYLLLDERLSRLAPEVAAMTGGSEVIALGGGGTATAAAAGTTGSPPVNRLRGAPIDRLPVLTRKLRAVALSAPTEGRLRDAIRALEEGGRMVILNASSEVRSLVGRLPVRVVADEEAAWVGVVEGRRETDR